MLAALEPRARELERNQANFRAFLEALDDAQWQTIVGDEGYSVRQTVAHLCGADKSMLRMAQNWLAGKNNTLRPDFDLNLFNARQQEKRAQAANAALLQEWIDAQQELLAFMETLQPQDLDVQGEHPTAKNTTLRQLFLIITSHEAQHIGAVMNALTE